MVTKKSHILKQTCSWTLSVQAAGLFKFVWPFCHHQALKGLTNREFANLRKVFANNSSADIKLLKTKLSKMIKLGGFLARLLGPLLKTGLPLMKNVIKPLAQSVLILLGLTEAASTADAGIHKKS